MPAVTEKTVLARHCELDRLCERPFAARSKATWREAISVIASLTVFASAAKQSRLLRRFAPRNDGGLLRRYAPRNDGGLLRRYAPRNDERAIYKFRHLRQIRRQKPCFRCINRSSACNLSRCARICNSTAMQVVAPLSWWSQ